MEIYMVHFLESKCKSGSKLYVIYLAFLLHKGMLSGDVEVRQFDEYTDDDDEFIKLSTRPNLSFV